MSSISFHIKEMSCANCSENIVKSLNKNGLYDVEVDFANKIITVNFNETEFEVEQIKKIISKSGFKPVMVN